MFTRTIVIVAAVILMAPLSAVSGYYTFAEPPDFTLTISPGFVNMDPGSSTSLDVTIVSLRGLSSEVDLHVLEVPEGVNATFDRNATELPGGGNATLSLKIEAAEDAVSSVGELVIGANSGGISHKVSSTLNIIGEGEVVIVIRNFWYYPDKVTVRAGTDVTWVNEDAVGHTSTSNDGIWNSRLLGFKQTYTFTFNDPGSYGYYCIPHPQMVGTVKVVE